MKVLLSILFTGMMLPALAWQQPKTNKVVKPAAPPPQQLPAKKVLMAGRALKDRILLRWAPDDPNAWKLCNKYGYAIERYTVARDGKALPKPELLKGDGIIRPQELEKWDSVMLERDDYAAVIAQAIYGETFGMEMGEQGAQNILIQAGELEQRYTMALYGADHSFRAARMAGLGWLDAKVKPNEAYFYRIRSLVPPAIMNIEPAVVYISLKDHYPLPAPRLSKVDFGDKIASVRWNFKTQRTLYNSYYVERSENGKDFKSITDKPYTNMTADDAKDAEMLTYFDTLQHNDKKYYYRIRGVSAFGEVGEPSNVIAGSGLKSSGVNPFITKALPSKKGYTVYWDFPDSLNDAIVKFSLSQASSMNSTYASLIDSIPVGKRSFEFDPGIVSYVQVEVLERGGEIRRSYPFMVQPEDSVPPSVPIALKGRIDSTGRVYLDWSRNAEKDLMGYMIYRSSSLNNEFSLVQDTAWKGNSFIDSISVNSLNREIYYAVAAVDRRYNQSKYCQPLLLLKPDVIPPSDAVIAGYELNDHGIRIRITPSSSKDVVKHVIYRKNINGMNQWEKIKDTMSSAKEISYMDSIKAGGNYAYTVIAVDSSSLESQPAQPLTVYIPVKVRGKINELKLGVDRQLREIAVEWSAMAENGMIKSFELYRGGDKQKISLYKVIDNRTATSFADKDLLVNTKYTYGIRAVFSDGGYSDMQVKTVVY
ncbi:hypothetical protein LZZ85_25820 [Terrimonas sp. NA20]|uniref:Fibronectin type III domain-containing protein n=1 Tax=Terrimonas ginsenosidimutans TaxID=2908004 RepID=A0ABS9KZL6_9BACT|nr:hypothetical protein [Terrimonas ginsenosidimutans]MCG2617746.1 hypothetical protein [Terrimonas ginsenosidimutans]